MYHCVPRIISGLSQIFGLSFQATMPDTTIGNSRLAGKAARNCATGCTRLAARGRVPTQTPIGTQMTLAIAMSTMTRVKVASPSSNTVPTSARVMPSTAKRTICHKATAASAATITPSWNAIQPGPARGAGAAAATLSGRRGRSESRHSIRERPRQPFNDTGPAQHVEHP